MATWTKKKFKDICSRVDYGFTASATHDCIGPKFLRITDIVPSIIDWRNVPFCKISETDKYLLADGDIVVARTGATTGYAKCLKNPPKAVFASYLVRFRVNESNDKRFVGHVIQSDLYKKFVTKNLGGSAQPQANAQILGSYELSLPEKEEQSRVAFVLSTYDDLIENNEKRIKALEEMAQLLYTEWFVKFKFPGHEKVKMVESGTEYGMIPEGWEVKRLSDVVSAQYGFTASAEENNDYPKYLRGTDINKKSFIDWQDVPNCKISEDDLKKYKIKKNDVFIIRMADPGKIGICEREIKAVFASYLMRLNIKSALTSYYLYYFVTFGRYQSFVLGASGGTTRKSINSQQVGAIDVLIPPIDILENFELKVSLIRDELTKLLQQNNSLSKIRNLLIPQLVTGKRILK